MFHGIVRLGREIYEALLYIIAPPMCYACRSYIQERVILCHACQIQTIPIAPKILQINSDYVLRIHAASKYDGPIKRLILAKHTSQHIVIRGLAHFMYEQTIISSLDVDCFVPIPLHWTRKFKRGFNQADIIANYLSKKVSKPVYPLLKRVKKTTYQARLEKEEREQNVKGAFELSDKGFDVQGKHIVLVDDLCTTGATAVQAAKQLVRLRPASISLIVACRAL